MAQWLRIHQPLQEMQNRSLGWEDPLEEEMATRSSILAWKIPWTEEPGKLQSSSVRFSCSIVSLCDPMVCSPPGSSVRGIFQARILEWVAISYSKGYSQPRD